MGGQGGERPDFCESIVSANAGSQPSSQLKELVSRRPFVFQTNLGQIYHTPGDRPWEKEMPGTHVS